MPVSISEEIKRGPNVIPVGNENLENAVKVFGKGLAIELHHSVEGLEGFVGQIGFAIDSDQVREEGGSNGLGFGFEATEEIVDEREVSEAAQFEDEDEVGGIRVAEVGLERSVVEDFFGEKRV